MQTCLIVCINTCVPSRASDSLTLTEITTECCPFKGLSITTTNGVGVYNISATSVVENFTCNYLTCSVAGTEAFEILQDCVKRPWVEERANNSL